MLYFPRRDNIPHIKDEHLSYDLNAMVLQNLTDILSTLNIPIYPTLGNHDYWPTDQFPADNNKLYNATWDRWKEWIGDTLQEVGFKKGLSFEFFCSSHPARNVK